MRAPVIIWLLLLCAAPIAGAGPARFTAKVEEPVLEELMGGCSLKCAFGWTVQIASAGTAKPAATKVLNDESAQTFWCAAGGPEAGVGTKIYCYFPKQFPVGMDGKVPFYGFDIINGAWRTEEDWKACGRIKRARLWLKEKPLAELSFADSRRWERVAIPDVELRSGDFLVLEVLEIYPGTKRGLALTEIVLEGAH